MAPEDTRYTFKDDDFEAFSTRSDWTTLRFVNCSRLPDDFGAHTAQLVELRLSECDRLQLQPDLRQLQHLVKLELWRCCHVIMSSPLGQLTSLQLLIICECSDLTRLPEPICELVTLRELHIRDCSSLQLLPESVSTLVALQVLNLSGCSSIRSLPKAMGGLELLKRLSLDGCTALESLPNSLGHLAALEVLELAGCSSLQRLPELIKPSGNSWRVAPLLHLTKLDLEGCSSLTRLPDTWGLLPKMKELTMSGCSSLTHLPAHMAKMAALEMLDLQSCSSLVALPRSLGTKFLDLSYCYLGTKDTLAQSLVDLAPQLEKAKTKVAMHGWDELLVVDEYPVRLTRIMQQLKTAVIIHRLLTDRGTILELLSRLSWLAVLLAAATFTAAIAPPGGYEDGLLYLPYGYSDCAMFNGLPANSSTVTSNTTATCTISNGTLASCSIADDTSSCIQKADQCSDNLNCAAVVKQHLLRMFYRLDLLSFGLSMALVLFVVAGSIPSSSRRSPEAAAGLTYLSLAVASGLLAAAVACGMGALVAGVLSVYPSSLAACDVWAPVAVSLALMFLATVILVGRLWALRPGWKAVLQPTGLVGVGKAVSSACQALGARVWHQRSNASQAGASDASV